LEDLCEGSPQLFSQKLNEAGADQALAKGVRSLLKTTAKELETVADNRAVP